MAIVRSLFRSHVENVDTRLRKAENLTASCRAARISRLWPPASAKSIPINIAGYLIRAKSLSAARLIGIVFEYHDTWANLDERFISNALLDATDGIALFSIDQGEMTLYAYSCASRFAQR
jgi:hypothetical protein